MSTYEPGGYWENLLGSTFDESGVGYPELARSLNVAMYRTLESAVAYALEAAGVQSPQRVLDVGSGTGVWIDFWRRRGATEITGVDLTASSVERLAQRWPGYSFRQADVGSPDAHLPGHQDVVSAMSVLLHIVDEARFRQAFVNLAAALSPNGTLVLIEPAVVHHWWGAPFGDDAASKARPLEDYRSALAAAGLEIHLLRPATVLLSNVGDTRSALAFHLLERYWSLLAAHVGRRERLARPVAGVLGALDRTAIRVLPTGPSAKVLVVRHMR